MRVVISMPDRLFRAAERAAKQAGVPRSWFYARAVEAYLQRVSSREGSREITARLNAVYAKEKPDLEFLNEAARRTALRNPWG